MTYLSRELSQKLQELGCISAGNFRWCVYKWGDASESEDWLPLQTDDDRFVIIDERFRHYHPLWKALSWPDLCLPENAKKAWGDKPDLTEYDLLGWTSTYQYKLHEMVDLLPNYNAIEKYVWSTLKGAER